MAGPHPRPSPDLAVLVVAEPDRSASRTGVLEQALRALGPAIVGAPDVEAVLLDPDASPRDATHAAARAAGFAVLPHAGLRRGALRNRGLAATSAPLVLFVAADFVATPGLVAAHRAFHREAGGDDRVAIGPGLFPPALRADPFRRWVEDSGALFGVSFTRTDPARLASFFYAANASLPRRLLARAGPFREDFDGLALDDDEMGRRLRALGVAVTYLPDAVAVHDHPVTLAERRAAVRTHGRAAARRDATSAEPVPWPTDLSRTTAGLYARALAARARAAVLGGERRRAHFYRRLLAADFARGYREARAGGTPAPDARPAFRLTDAAPAASPGPPPRG